MLKVKIINTEDLYLNAEETAINEGIRELLSSDSQYVRCINKIVYRQNSVIIEYYEYLPEDTERENCCSECAAYSTLVC